MGICRGTDTDNDEGEIASSPANALQSPPLTTLKNLLDPSDFGEWNEAQFFDLPIGIPIGTGEYFALQFYCNLIKYTLSQTESDTDNHA